MVRNVAGFSVVALVAFFGLKLIMGLLGAALGLIVTVLIWAFYAFVIYTLLKIFAPGVAGKIRDTVRGTSTST